MQQTDRPRDHILHWKAISFYLVLFDIFALNASYILALWVRFDCHYSAVPMRYVVSWLRMAPFYTLVGLLVFWRMRLYNSLWRYASFSELTRLAIATVLTLLAHIALSVCCFHFFPGSRIIRMPISYFAFGIVTQFFFMLISRFSYRFLLVARELRRSRAVSVPIRVLLIGAGSAGQQVLHSLHSAEHAGAVKERICCIIDDNPNKWHRYIDDVPIVGGREDILKAVAEYKIDKIIVAIPSATAAQKRDILNICKETGCELKNLPDIYRFMTGEMPVLNALADVSMEDLLGREPVKVDMEEIFRFLRDKVILVTGGGGSIGSELCRQIAGHAPRQLIIFDMYENNAYEIEGELRKKYPALDLVVLIGSVRDSGRINSVFETYHPDIVYHAAAHKHVPLMETSPNEAIKNNVFGTYKTAYAAMRNNCGRFVLISTDKAVNPTNVMGASKRMCEMVVQSFDRMIREGRESEIPRLCAHMNDEDGYIGGGLPEGFHSRTEFVAVRFGNVLGSNGSVVPLFKKQIQEGGPVTVTHPDIVRYFMTISEAVSLVLQAGTYAESGTIFVLDMGDAVKIDTLARNLIKLAGLRPDVDIKIMYTGLRPGEKLYEEKLMDEEGLRTTPNKLILIGRPIPMDMEKFFRQLKRLIKACYAEDTEIRNLVGEIVETYQCAIE